MISENKSDKIILDRGLTDTIKFLASVMIALHHYSQLVLSTGVSDNLIYKLFSTQGGYLGVALFFFFSGYGVMMSDIKNHFSLVQFFKKRILKIYRPVVLITIVWLPVIYMKSGGVNDMIQILKDLCWGWKDGVLWYVKVLFILYVLFYIYTEIRILKPNYKVVYIILFTFLAYFITYKLFPIYCTISVPLFFIGVLLAEYRDAFYQFFHKWWGYLFGFVVFAAILVIGRGQAMVYHAMFNYILIFIALVFLSYYSVNISNVPKWMGNFSFDVYLVHNKVLTIYKTCWPVAELSPWLFLIASFIASFIFYRIRLLLKI